MRPIQETLIPRTAIPPPTREAPPPTRYHPEQIREQKELIKTFQTQVETAEEAARQEFQTQLETQKQTTRQEFQKQLAVHKPTYGEAWAQQEATKFETELAGWEREEIGKWASEVDKWRRQQYETFHEQLKTWRVTWKPPSLTERILAWKAPAIMPFSPKFVLGIPTKKGVLQIGVEPFKGIAAGAEAAVAAGAGFVGAVESLVYGVEALAGLPTPRPPPSPIGAAIGTLAETIIQRKPAIGAEAKQIAEMKYPVSYAAGGMLAEVGLSYLIGKGVEAVARKAIIEPFKRAYKFSKLEMALIRRSERLARRAAKALPPQIVSVPRLPEKVGMEWIKTAKAVDVAWALMQTPKTAGLIITPTKVIAPKAVRKLPTLLAWVGAGVIEKLPPLEKAVKIRPISEELKKAPAGFEKYKWRMPVDKAGAFVKGKLPTVKDLLKETKAEASLLNLLVTPTKVRPALQYLPYFARKAAVTYPTLSSTILGTAGLAGIRALTRPAVAPTLKPRIKPVPALAIAPIISEVVSPVVSPIVSAIEAQKEKAAQVLRLKTVLTQTILTPTAPSIPLAPPAPPVPISPIIPTRRKIKKRKPRKRKVIRPLGWGLQRIIYPVRGVKSAAQFIFGKD